MPDPDLSIPDRLDHFGYAVEPGVLPPDRCEALADHLDALEAEDRDAGRLPGDPESQVTLFNVHLRRPDLFLDLVDLPPVMAVVASVLHEPAILSNFNATRPGPRGGRRIHIDSRVPIRDFGSTIQMVAMLCLDDFDETNGATIVWPESHRSGEDPRPLRGGGGPPGGRPACAPRGAVLYTLGQTWHDNGPARPGTRRWGIIAYYARWWVKPTFDFTRCGEGIYRRLSRRQRALFGFNSRPPADTAERTHTLTPVESIPDAYEEAIR